MDVNKATSPLQLRNHDAFKTPNLVKPPKKSVTVSAAAIFKKQKLDTPHIRSSSHSLQKSTVKKPVRRRQEEEVHPLAVAFKGTALYLLISYMQLMPRSRDE